MKKLIALALVLCLVMSCTVFAVAATETSGEFILGTPTQVDIGYDYTFVLPEDGIYVITTADDCVISHGPYGMQDNPYWFHGTKGEAVTFSAASWDYEKTSATVTIWKATAPEAIIPKQNTYEGYVGLGVDIYYGFAPESGFCDAVSAEVADSSIATIDGYARMDGWIDFNLHKAGSTTVTLTTANGKTATVTIIVHEPPTISVGQTVDLPNEEIPYRFTPSEAGVYCLKVDSSHYSGPSIYHPYSYVDAEYYDGCHYFHAEANEAVFITLENLETDAGENATATLTKATEATAFSLQMDCGPIDEYFFPGKEYRVSISESDGYLGNIEWAVSDPANAQIQSSGHVGSPYFIADKAGTYTVTATAENGGTASVTVWVGYPEVQCGEFTFTESGRYTFIPTETGEYVFYTNGSVDLYDSNYGFPDSSFLDSSDWSFGGYLYTLTAGEAYTVSTDLWNDEAFLGIEKAENLLSDEPTYTMQGPSVRYIGDQGQFIMTLVEPMFAKEQKWTWTSSDPDVAKITYSTLSSAYVNFLSKGTVTITATSDTGLVVTKTLTVTSISEYVTEAYTTHQITAGAAGTTTADNAYTFTVKGNADDFYGLVVLKNAGSTLTDEEIQDEANTVQLEAKDLTVTQRGDVFDITVSAATLKKLGNGQHCVVISMYTGNGEGGAMTTLTLQDTAPTPSNPPTGDNFSFILPVIAILCSVLGMGIVICKLHRKKF